jgi:iron-sulfur cluster repair protein YtfE (RIC family)
VTLVGKVGAIGGERRQELTEMRRLFRHLRISLEANLSREEHMLFPMVRQLVVHTHSRVHAQGLDSQLALLWAGHEAIRTHLGALRRVTGGYYVPSDGCRYESCYVALANLDRDTQRHLFDVEQLVVPAVHMWRVNSPVLARPPMGGARPVPAV